MAQKSINGNGWSKYEVFVLEKLDDITESIKNIYIKVGKIETTQARLDERMKIRSTFYGVVGAIIIALVKTILDYTLLK